MTYTEIARGLSCATKNDVSGELRYIRSPKDVVELIKTDPSGKICLLEQAGATTLGPIFSKIAGVVCTEGTRGSHLAIMSREFEIPAIMSCKFTIPLEKISGKKIKIHTEDGKTGIISVWNGD